MQTITIVIGGSPSAGFDWTGLLAELRGWGTLLAAVFAGWIAYQAFLRERRRDDIASDLRNQAQAAKFSFWRDETGNQHSRVHLLNVSDLPVTDVRVTVLSKSRSAAIAAVRLLPPEELETLDLDALTVVLGREEKRLDVVPPSVPKYIDIYHRFSPTETVVVFTDAQGVRWERTAESLAPSMARIQPAWFEKAKRLESYSWGLRTARYAITFGVSLSLGVVIFQLAEMFLVG